MPRYTITTPETERSGTVALSFLENAGFPYHFLGQGLVTRFQAHVPFSLVITKCRIEDESDPFQITILSPDFSMVTALSNDEFEELVCNKPPYQNTTYELLYVRSGEYYQRIENTRHKYVQDSFCLMNRNVRHAPDYHTSVQTISLSLSRSFLHSVIAAGEENYFKTEKINRPTDLMRFLESEFKKEGSSAKKYIDFSPLQSSEKGNHGTSELIDRLIEQIRRPGHGTTLNIRAIIYQILTLLNDSEYYNTDPIQLGTTTESRLFSQITELMEETNGRISRSVLSERLNYSGNYINRVVLKFSGMNISEYGNIFTMQKAAQMLISSDKSVSEIAWDLDITDRTHFYKLFQKEFGMTPREYRIKNKARTEQAD